MDESSKILSDSISKSKTMTKQTTPIGSSSRVGFEIITEEEEKEDTPANKNEKKRTTTAHQPPAPSAK